jgi:hypothetical protein
MLPGDPSEARIGEKEAIREWARLAPADVRRD